MRLAGSHPLLEQVPLTVSPFVNLPVAPTLPYTYKTMPSALPPSLTGIAGSTAEDGGNNGSSSAAPASSKPRYVVSPSGHAAHPDDIVASCRALQAHVAKLRADADAELRALDERIRARTLAEKRRVAPGWLDSDARLLEPERKDMPGAGAEAMTEAPGRAMGMEGQFAGMSIAGEGDVTAAGGPSEMAVPDPGVELDRVFGGR